MVENATSVFSATFDVTSQNTIRARRASIGPLPVELLLIIFNFVYLESCVPAIPYIEFLNITYQTNWDDTDDLLSPSLFLFHGET